jgi:hypothetical protein
VSELETHEGKGTDFYKFLDVAPGASVGALNRAYRKRSLELQYVAVSLLRAAMLDTEGLAPGRQSGQESQYTGGARTIRAARQDRCDLEELGKAGEVRREYWIAFFTPGHYADRSPLRETLPLPFL